MLHKAVSLDGCVAPFTGAWIEMVMPLYGKERLSVAPFARAWIEIMRTDARAVFSWCRSLRESVD